MFLFLLVVCSSAAVCRGVWIQETGGESRIVSPQIEEEEPIKLIDGAQFKASQVILGSKPYPVIMQKTAAPVKFVIVRKTKYSSLLGVLTDRLRHRSEPKSVPIHSYVERKILYPMEKAVPVPMEEYVEVHKPYPVPVVLEKKVPVIMEKKVPVKVEVPVEKPYPVEVEVPYEITSLKKVPFIVERKVPYQVDVPEYVEVPVPMFENYEEESVAPAKSINETAKHFDIERNNRLQ